MHNFRFLERNKGYALINLIGLATGLAACLLMVSYLKYQYAFDTFHANKDRIYRCRASIQFSGKENATIHLPGLLGEIARNEVPGVESSLRLHTNLRYEVLCDTRKFTDQKIFYADSTLFNIFSFPVISGNPHDLLKAPFTVVLTRHAAKKMFGDNNPIGKSLKIDDLPYEVTGLMEDVPENSHITFDLLASLCTLTRTGNSVVDREGFTFPTYILLKEGVAVQSVIPQLNQILDRIVQQKYGNTGMQADVFLQPLLTIHTTQLQATDYARTTPRSTLSLFTAVAIFLLLVGVINFINLTTSLYERRSKEIGIKKAIGATRQQLFWQTMLETSTLVSAALVIALILCEWLRIWVRSRWNLNLPLFYQTSLSGAILLIIGTAVIIFLSSAYPNWYLSRLSPGTILKEESLNRSRKFGMGKILVLLQYGISGFIICLMLLFSAQLKYVSKADLGFDIKNVVVFENLTDQLVVSYNYLKSRILQHPIVATATASFSIPGKYRVANSVVYKYGGSPSSGELINVNRVQQDYIKTYGIHLVQGEDFSQTHERDSLSYIINEEAVKKLGLIHPIGEELVLKGVKGKVIGVVGNFRTKPLYSDYDKEILTMQSNWFNFISIRLNPGYTGRDIKELESVLTGADPGYQPVSFFVEDMYREFYQREENQVNLVFSGAIVGILLSVMGLVSLMVLTLKKQRKEIGVRKVFGASGETIFFLLVNRMMKWVLLSNLISWPVAYLVTEKWLERFSYRISLVHEWPLFLLSGGIIAVLAFLSICVQSYHAARISPADIIQRS